jgi:tetratricopeptide (TPR) repeat protein
MRLFAILLFSICFSCSSEKKSDCNYVTDYYPNTAKAEVEFYLGNYDKAYEYYQKAFENCDAIKLGAHHDTVKFAKVCAELGKDKLALEYIEKTIEKGGTLNEFQSDNIFDKILKSPQGEKIIAQYDKKRDEYLHSLNMDLRTELQEMIAIDQSLVGKQKERDSVFKVNDLRLLEIFEKFGYPNEQVIGNFGIDFTNADPTILLLHTDDSIRINYFIPKVKEFIKKGKCPPYVLGVMI